MQLVVSVTTVSETLLRFLASVSRMVSILMEAPVFPVLIIQFRIMSMTLAVHLVSQSSKGNGVAQVCCVELCGAHDNLFLLADQYFTDVDECQLWKPCQNGGTCTDLAFNYSCSCIPGYTGRNCTIYIGPSQCASQPCQHGSSCIDQITTYSCICSPGWTGFNCSIGLFASLCPLDHCHFSLISSGQPFPNVVQSIAHLSTGRLFRFETPAVNYHAQNCPYRVAFFPGGSNGTMLDVIDVFNQSSGMLLVLVSICFWLNLVCCG
jgi:hypothetical protein